MSDMKETEPSREPEPPAHVAYERQKSARRQKAIHSRFGGLETIAISLNTYAGQYATVTKEWEMIASIVTAKSLSQKMKLFEDYAGQHPIALTVRETETSKSPKPGLTAPGDDPRAGALLQLWWHYFHDSGWERLKQCTVCSSWFTDVSNAKTALRCSPACTWTYWNKQRLKPSAG